MVEIFNDYLDAAEKLKSFDARHGFSYGWYVLVSIAVGGVLIVMNIL